MLNNYLKLALRNLVRHRGYAFINLLGLAIGLACFVMIARYVQVEMSFDTFHANAANTYRVVQWQPGNMYQGSDRYAVTPAPLAATMVEEIPEVTTATTLSYAGALLGEGNQHFQEAGLWADPSFFEVFTFPLVEGDGTTALSSPEGIVLTQMLAEKLFGIASPMGKTVDTQDGTSRVVTGVVQDPPASSQLQFSFLMPIASNTYYTDNLDHWDNSSYYTFVTLRPGSDAAAVDRRLQATVTRIYGQDRDPSEVRRLYLQPLLDIHLWSDVNFDMPGTSDAKRVYVFSAIALIILLLACINYTNLAVARSMKRAREVGLRKVVGAQRYQLALQFLGEATLLSFLALVLGLLMAHFAMPVFERLVGRSLSLDVFGDPRLLAELVGLTLLVGLVAGGYPALIASALRPTTVLKGSADGGYRRSRLRSLLVVGQLTAAIILIVGSLVVYRQLHYIQTTDVGYDREHVVTMRVSGTDMSDNVDVFKRELRRNANVVAVSVSTHLPTDVSSQTTVGSWEGSAEDDRLPIYQLGADADFFDVFGIQKAQGRLFDERRASDTTRSVILNETAVKALGWENPIGKRFDYRGPAVVVGVVKDFHLHSLHQPIKPLVIAPNLSWQGYVSVRVGAGDLPQTVGFIEETWKSLSDYPFRYQFLDDVFDQQYRTDVNLGRTLEYFTLLALLIAALGLFGLATFAAEQRTKEIGVRKVMGASVGQIVRLITTDFARLVAVAYAVAVVPAYLIMQRWLEDFAYRVDVSWAVLAAAGLIALFIALATVSYQAVSASLTDPVEALRYE